MIGCAGPSFDTSSTPSPDISIQPATASQRLSFFSLCVASAVTWAPSSADYFVYLSPALNPGRVFLSASAAMSLAMILTTLLGIGLATGVSSNGNWMDASLTSQGSLLTVAFSTLNGFGRLCAVMLLLSAVSNNIPCTYSAGLNLQMILGRYGPRVPRPLLTTVEVIVCTVCAVVARDYLREIMEAFLPLMSYWIAVWLAVCLEEACIFRRKGEYDWSIWNTAHKLPMGLAAGMSLVIGCLGAVLGMVRDAPVRDVGVYALTSCSLSRISSVLFRRPSLCRQISVCGWRLALRRSCIHRFALWSCVSWDGEGRLSSCSKT